MYYIEHCERVFDRSGHMVPLKCMDMLTGFRSAYAFSKEDAQEIQSNHSSVGFSRYSVFSDTWLMDFDNNEQGMLDTIKWVKEKNLGYKLYESGGKGFHIEIPTVEKYDNNLPAIHKEMAKSLNTGIDLSIYRHSSLYRLPNTIHEKTGKPKQLLEEETGQFLLEIPDIDIKPREFNLLPLTEFEEFRWGMLSITNHIEICPGSGNRHDLLWRAAADLCKAGISFDTTLELLLALNKSWGTHGKEESEIQRSAREGYKYITGNDISR